MKILITGANGYIGSHIVTNLLNLNQQVWGCDIQHNRIDHRAHYINYNVFNSGSGTENLYELLGSPDVCLHFAWRDGFKHNSNNHILDVSSHYRFLTNLINHGLSRLVVMGSMHEVGYYEGVIDENTPCNPMSMYGIAKNALRQSLMLYTKDTNCTLQWLRGFYIYGDDLLNHSIFTKLLEADAEGKIEFPFNSGQNKYDFIQVNDLVTQICATILQNKINGIINCCSGKPIPLGEKVEEFIQKNHLKIKLKYGAFPDRPYDSPCVYGNPSKINLILNNYINGSY